MKAEQEIKKLLKNKGISQKQLAEASGIKEPHISRYLSGKVQMSANRYLELKEIINKL